MICCFKLYISVSSAETRVSSARSELDAISDLLAFGVNAPGSANHHHAAICDASQFSSTFKLYHYPTPNRRCAVKTSSRGASRPSYSERTGSFVSTAYEIGVDSLVTGNTPAAVLSPRLPRHRDRKRRLSVDRSVAAGQKTGAEAMQKPANKRR
jgi:hypothetical protein